jgi:type I restriction enzyme S subunit
MFSRWLYYYFQSETGRREIAKCAEGAHLVPRWVRRIPVCVPDEATREVHLTVFGLLDESISTARCELKAANRLKKGLMQQLFTKGILGRYREFKMTKIGEVPEEWDVIKLKKCGKWGTGGTPDRDNKAYWNGMIPWIKSGEVNYHIIYDSEEKITEAGAASINGELLPCGTMLVAMYGAGVTRGKTALLGFPAYINQAIAYFRGDEQTDNQWLQYWFERNYERVRTLAGGANQDNLSLYLLKNIEIARPEKKEQSEIVELLKHASDYNDAIFAKINSLQHLKHSLLQNLLTGKVHVNKETKL